MVGQALCLESMRGCKKAMPGYGKELLFFVGAVISQPSSHHNLLIFFGQNLILHGDSEYGWGPLKVPGAVISILIPAMGQSCESL